MKILFFIIILSINFSKVLSEIVIIDLDLIINESNYGLEIKKKIENINNDNLKILNKLKVELDNEKNEIEKLKNLISKEELEKKIINYNSILKNYRENQEKISNDLQIFKNNEIKELLKKINPFIEAYMIENEINIVLNKDSVYIFNSDKDITKQILNLLNKDY
jgi:Skp family chaperone for outer membrane proteins